MDAKTPVDAENIREIFDTVCGSDATAKNIVEVDVEKYIQFLEESDLSDVQKREFIETIYLILINFIDIGFGIHPIQHVFDEIDPKTIDMPGDVSDNKDNSIKSLSEKLDRAAKNPAAERLES